MANKQGYVYLFVVLFSALAYNVVHAFQFTVGGKDGWTLQPCENYNRWAERMRFQVNDSLLFKYKNGSDSVVVVNKEEYQKCNTTNPILKLEDGNSVFMFTESGPVFFISGIKSNCLNGQKLIVIVLAVRSPPPKTPSVAAPPTEAPAQATGGEPSQPGNGSTGEHPRRRSFATPECIPSVILVSIVSLVLSVCFGEFSSIF